MPDAKAEIFHQVPDDLNEILTKHAKILAIWQSLTPKARNEWICWLTMVKKRKPELHTYNASKKNSKTANAAPAAGPAAPMRDRTRQSGLRLAVSKF
jgi:uncharacterized protein YdeI (YjbR/CyaY-like superfamily)